MTRIDTLIQNIERDLAALKAEVSKIDGTQIKSNQKIETPAETRALLSNTKTYIDFTK